MTIQRNLGLYIIALFLEMMFLACTSTQQERNLSQTPTRIPMFVYVVNQRNYDENLGEVSAFTMDANSGGLTQVEGSPFTAGPGATDVAVDPFGEFVYVSTESGVVGYSINADTGALTPIAGSPFTNGNNRPLRLKVHPSGRFLYANNASPDVSGFKIESNGALTAIGGSPFLTVSESRYADLDGLAFGATGKSLYVTNPAAANVSVFSIDESTGGLTHITGSPFTVGHQPRGIAVGVTGSKAYVADPTDLQHTLFVIDLDPLTGAMTQHSSLELGAFEEEVTITPSGQFLYLGGVIITAFSIGDDGTPAPIEDPFGSSDFIGIPVRSMTVDPSGRFLYATANISRGPLLGVFAYAIDPTTGKLTELGNLPAVENPHGIAIATRQP